MMMIFSTIITIIIIMMIFAEREPQDGDDLRQLPDQHHNAVEEERPGGTSLQRVRPLLQAPRGEESELIHVTIFTCLLLQINRIKKTDDIRSRKRKTKNPNTPTEPRKQQKQKTYNATLAQTKLERE